MRNTDTYPVTYDEQLEWLRRQMAVWLALHGDEQSVGDVIPLIIKSLMELVLENQAHDLDRLAKEL